MTDRPRTAALELLRTVREDGAYANLALPQILHGFGLSGRDAAFATELAYGTLRGQRWYDAVLEQCVTRPYDKVDPAMKDILRLGAHQLLSMRVPDHAAVDSSCALARDLGARPGADARAGFVNAVLRKVAAVSAEDWSTRIREDRPATDPDWLGTRWSHPTWIVRSLRDALGPRQSELESLLIADNAPARPTLVARPGRMDPEELHELPEVEPGRWSPLAGTLIDGTPDALACVRDGRAGVQDEGSQLVALALARVDVPDDQGRWLDMCAGPGERRPSSTGWPPSAAATWSPSSSIRIGSSWSNDRSRPARPPRSWSATPAMRPGASGSSTECWSTRRAPGWGPCVAGRSPGGDAPRRISRRSAGCSGTCCARRSRPSGQAASSAT